MKKRIVSIIFVVLMIAEVFSGCTSKNTTQTTGNSPGITTAATTTATTTKKAEPIALTLLGYCTEDSPEGKIFYPALDEFMKGNPDIKVTSDMTRGDDLKRKIQADAAANNLPGVFYYWTAQANARWLYQADVLVKLDDLIAASSVLKSEWWPSKSSARVTTAYKGVNYSVPLDIGYQAYLVNSPLYEKYGLISPADREVYTYEQYRADAKVFIANGLVPNAIGFKGGNHCFHWLSAIVSQLPGGLEEMNSILAGTYKPGSGIMAKAIKYLQDDIKLGIYGKDYLNNDFYLSAAMYAQSVAPSMYNYNYYFYEETLGGKQPQEFTEIANVPMIPGLAVKNPAFFDTSGSNFGLFVSKGKFNESPHRKDAIMKFIDWFCGPYLPKFAMTTELGLQGVQTDLSIRPKIVQKAIARRDNLISSGKVINIFSYINVISDSQAWVSFKNVLMEACAFNLTPEEFEKKAGELFVNLNSTN